MATGPLNQFIIEDVNLLETPESGFCNIMIASDKTIWGRFPDGTLHQFSANNVLTIVGSLDPSGGNINYPAADAGDIYIFTSAGTIGAPPVAVEQGEMLLCITDSAGGAGAGADFTIYQINIQYATESVAGIILIATQLKMQSNADDLAAITPAKLYYLLQQFGMTFIISDEIRGRSLDGSNTMIFTTRQNPDVAGPQSEMEIKTVPSVDGTGLFPSADAGTMSIYTGNSGNSETAPTGVSGSMYIFTGNAGDCTTSGNAGDSGELQISTGLGGNTASGNGGNAGDLDFGSGFGGNSTDNGSGGNGGIVRLIAGSGGLAQGAGQSGGNGGAIEIEARNGGQATNTGGIGGGGSDITILAGGSGQGDAGAGSCGSVIISAGNAEAVNNGASGSEVIGGNIQITSGAGNTSGTGFPGSGGFVFITSGPGRNQTVDGGVGSKGSDAGDIRIFAGNGGNGITEAGTGGGIEIACGGSGTVSEASGTGTDGADVLITAASGGSASGVTSTGGNGGDIIVTPGDGGIGTSTNGYKGTFDVEIGFFALGNIHNNVTAFAGGGFTDATRLTGVNNRISTCATNGDSVKLPLSAKHEGEEFRVRNDGAADLAVFPSINTETINGAASITVAAGTSVTIVRFTATQYYTV